MKQSPAWYQSLFAWEMAHLTAQHKTAKREPFSKSAPAPERICPNKQDF